MTRDVRKTVCFAVCVAILLVAVGLLAWATSGFKNWNADTWFNSWGKGSPVVTVPDDSKDSDKPDVPDTPNTDEPDVLETKTYDDLSVASHSAQAFQLRSARSASSDNSFTLTATVTDDEGNSGDSIQAVTWAMSWNGTDFSWTEDTWAALEEDLSPSSFVSMTTDGTTATFTLNCVFGTQIKVTCTSNIDNSKSATATIDYCRRLKSLKAQWGSSATEQTIFTTSHNDCFELTLPWQEAQADGDYPTMPGQVQLNRGVTAPGVTGIAPVSGWEYGIGSIDDPIINTNSYVEIVLQPISGYSGKYEKTYADLANYIYTDSSLIEVSLMGAILKSNQNIFYNDGSVYEFNNRDKDFLVHLHFVTQQNKVYDIRYYVDVIVPQPNISSVTIDTSSVLL